MAKQKKHPSGTIALNKKALHDYFVEHKFEAGLALSGWEVKSLRAGKAQLVDSYVLLKDDEAWLMGCHITPQLACTNGVGDDVGAGRGQGGEVATHQPGFAVLEQHVAVHQLRLAGTQAFYFPTGQDQASLETVFDEVIVSRFLVLRDGPCRMFL